MSQGGNCLSVGFAHCSHWPAAWEPLFEFANRSEVLIEPRAIAASEAATELPGRFCDNVENTALPPQLIQTLGNFGLRSLHEHLLEKRRGAVFRRK